MSYIDTAKIFQRNAASIKNRNKERQRILNKGHENDKNRYPHGVPSSIIARRKYALNNTFGTISKEVFRIKVTSALLGEIEVGDYFDLVISKKGEVHIVIRQYRIREAEIRNDNGLIKVDSYKYKFHAVITGKL